MLVSNRPLHRWLPMAVLAGSPLVSGLSAMAAVNNFAAVGVYDEDVTNTNAVDRNGNNAAIGSIASATNIARFKPAVLSAYNADIGGVVNFDNLNGVADSTLINTSDPISATYGVGQTKSILITPTPTVGTTYNITTSTNVVGISGANAPGATVQGNMLFPNAAVVPQERIFFGAITNGLAGEAVTQVGFTLLGRNYGAATNVPTQQPSVVAVFNDATSSTLNAIVFTNNSSTVSTSQDTFYSFVAPTGKSISYVSIAFAPGNGNHTRLGVDDLGFITSVVTPEPASLSVLFVAGAVALKRRRKV